MTNPYLYPIHTSNNLYTTITPVISGGYCSNSTYQYANQYANVIGSAYPAAITVTDTNGRQTFVIDTDGNISYAGKPSKAAEVLMNAIGASFDKTSKKSMLSRAYIRANDRILKMLKKMTKEELIAKLEEEQNNRQNMEIYNRLSESEDI